MRKGSFKSKPRTPQRKKKPARTSNGSPDAPKSDASTVKEENHTHQDEEVNLQQEQKEKIDEKIPAEGDLKPTEHENKDTSPESTPEKPIDKPDKGKKKVPTSAPKLDNSESGKPRILLVAIYVGGEFDSYYAPFYSKLLSMASVQRANSPKPVMRYLRHHKPQAIILLDSALAHRKEFASVTFRIIRYVRNGGTLICANTFNSYLAPFFNKKRPTLPLFRLAGLSWEFGDVYTTYMGLNKQAVGEDTRAVLPQDLTFDGILLSKVPRTEAWYLPSVKSISDALAFDGRKPEPEWTSVAFAKVGDGCFGYVGDLNVDGTCDGVIIAMIGLSVEMDCCLATRNAEKGVEPTKDKAASVPQTSESKVDVPSGSTSAP